MPRVSGIVADVLVSIRQPQRGAAPKVVAQLDLSDAAKAPHCRFSTPVGFELPGSKTSNSDWNGKMLPTLAIHGSPTRICGRHVVDIGQMSTTWE